MGKTNPSKPYKQGLPEGQGRNGVSPFKGIDTRVYNTPYPTRLYRRNGVSPFKGIDTQYQYNCYNTKCRNGVSPFKGIDTQ